MEKLVGQVSENEKNDMIDICEVKVALDNLEKIVGKDEAELLEQITRERDITNEKYNAWWDSIRENYDLFELSKVYHTHQGKNTPICQSLHFFLRTQRLPHAAI